MTRSEYEAKRTPKGSYPKEETLTYWKGLDDDNPLRHMTPIPYKSEGSSYGACGVRIDGSPEFVDAVLSKLKDLIDGENGVTRLELSRSKVSGESLGKKFHKMAANAEVCYIRLHERGREGSMATMFFDRDAREASERYAELIGA